VDITIHLTGAIEWTGWILAMVLAAVLSVSLYGGIKAYERSEKYKQFAKFARKYPERSLEEIGEMTDEWWGSWR
jgi:hypothetical protein